MNLIQKIKILTFTPRRDILSILQLGKYKYIYLFPIVYGIVTGISKYISLAGMTYSTYFLGVAVKSSLTLIFAAIVLCFIYSWTVWFISVSLKGIANVGMIFTLALYSLTPMILGALLFLLLKIIVLSSNFLLEYASAISTFIYIFQCVFIIWSICVFIIGNKVLNQFSTIKSIVSSIGLIILFGLLAVYQKINN